MSQNETTRPTLLSQVRDSSDHEAWRQFDAKYRGLILGYCARRGLQAADAEDVRQIVMLGLSVSLRGFTYRPDVGRFRDYLRRVVQNTVLRYRAGWKPAPSDAKQLASLVDAGDDQLDATWEREWIYHHFRRAMQKASKAFRPDTLRIFEHLIAGSEPSDVAASFGLTLDAVQKIRARVRDHLFNLISEQVRAEEFVASR